ncbi:MAG: Amuc_1100 family pilus-like protein [Victivallales bacterium]|nr:Amuc_1100 family pilus-like protein [Victivallales bacterium]
MDLLKNNWGFWLITLVCVIAILSVGVCCSMAAGKQKTQVDNAAKQMTDFANVAKENLKLNDENVKIAETNQKVAEAGVKQMKQELTKRFQLNYTVPETSIEALRTLKDELAKMRSFLEDNNIEYSSKCEYFTFDAIAKATQPPNKDDLDSIFRHLAAIKIVLETCVKAKIDSLEDLSRPLGILEQDEGSYKFLPIELTIIAKPAAAQNLINLMSRADKNLFFFKYFELIADDKTTEIGKDIKDTAISGSSASSGRGGMSEPGMEMDMEGGGRRGRRGKRGMDNMGPGMDMEPGMGDAAGRTTNLVELPQRRQELLVYEHKTTKWTLRFDMILFNREEEEKTEETEENAD